MPPPDRSTAALCARIVHAPAFQRLVVAAILAAGLLAGLETSAALMAEHGDLLRSLDRLVLGVFLAELALKLGSHGRRPWDYFRDGWNVFDFAVVAVCCLPLGSQFAAVLRLARGLRLLRLVTALPKLQLLVGALLKSLGAMGYVGLLLGLMFYIYGVAGVHLFGAADPAHFGSLGAALLSLFQVITLDNWSDLLAGIRDAAPVLSLAYFVTFILLGTMIMLNLFIGIIMNSMSEMHAEIEGRKQAAAGIAPPAAPVARELEEQVNELRRLVRELARQRPAQDRAGPRRYLVAP